MRVLLSCYEMLGRGAPRVVLACILALSATTANADLGSISTRAVVQNGSQIVIAGFIITKADPLNPDGQQCVVIRGRGQSVSISSGKLADPYLVLKSGSTTLEENDDWRDYKYSAVLEEQGLAPGDPTDAAIYTCLDPGAYTAQLSPGDSATGVGIVEVVEADYFDVSQILAVDLRSDRTTVLAGDHLDFASAPVLAGNSTYNTGTRTLSISVESGGNAARWPELFEPGNYYYVSIIPSGVDSNISVKSGASTLGVISGDQSLEITEMMSAQDLYFVSSGANAANLKLSVRDAVEFSWTVSNAEICTTTGEWSGYQITPLADGSANGSEVFPFFSNLQQTYAFGLICDNSTQAAVGDAVNIVTSSCPGAGAVEKILWTDLLFSAGKGFNFPDPTGNSAVVSVARNTTLAIEFNTKTADLNEFYGNISNPEFAGVPGERQISISRCPGQFEDLPSRCEKSGYVSSGAVYWEIDNLAGNLGHTCKLERGAEGNTYYFNIRFPSGCGSSVCRTRIQP